MSDQLTNYSDEYVEALQILVPREVEVLEEVADGHTSREIGKTLNISNRTLEKYRQNICNKLDLSGYRGLFNWCLDYM